MRIKIILAIAIVSIFIFWMERRYHHADVTSDNCGRVQSLYVDSDEKAEELKHEKELRSRDTLNFIDKNGLRQGYWILYGNASRDVTFPSDRKWKEGKYVDSKEEGEWIFYNPDGSVKKKVNYKSGITVK